MVRRFRAPSGRAPSATPPRQQRHSCRSPHHRYQTQNHPHDAGNGDAEGDDENNGTEGDGEISDTELKIASDEIWYTNSRTTEATAPLFGANVFGANIVSNLYDETNERWVITFDGDVTSIGDRAFEGCSSLTSIALPESVTSIGQRAFEDCSRLGEVYCKATTPPTASTEWGAFERNATGRKIYVPAESVDAYKAAVGWKDYAAYIVGYDF